MVRSNIRNESIAKNQIRYVIPPTQNSVSADAIQDVFENGTEDPRALLEEKLRERLAKAYTSKKTAPVVQSKINYAENEEEYFWEMDDWANNHYYQKKYILLATYPDYNLWVSAGDIFYEQDSATFKQNAIKAGERFITGYKMVTKIFGEASSKIYNKDSAGNYTAVGNMSELSPGGERINILFFSMLNKDNPKAKISGYNGFVSDKDLLSIDTDPTSNQGRFLYIDSSEILNDMGIVYTTMLHEFSHTITGYQKLIKNGKTGAYWYGELLAMLCEDMMQSYLGVPEDVNAKSVDGVSSLGTTPKSRLALANKLGGRWGLTGDKAEVYAEAFKLGAWLARRFGGAMLVKELATNAFVDWDSIVNAVNTVNQTNHTVQSLMELFMEDMLEQKAGAGLNQDAKIYTENAELIGDNNGTNYYYPFTAIDLWNDNHFYDWYEPNAETYIQNKTVDFAILPATNTFKKFYAQNPPAKAYVGPRSLKCDSINDIGPYGYVLTNLGTAAQDAITFTFGCDGEQFGDTVTIFAK